MRKFPGISQRISGNLLESTSGSPKKSHEASADYSGIFWNLLEDLLEDSLADSFINQLENSREPPSGSPRHQQESSGGLSRKSAGIFWNLLEGPPEGYAGASRDFLGDPLGYSARSSRRFL